MQVEALNVKKLMAVSDLIRLPRQYGTLLVLWPTLWSLLIASNGTPNPVHLGVFILGCFLMRSAGCAINDVADRKFDPHVERTRLRPLASGALSVKEALAVFLILSAIAFALVAFFLNPLALALSVVGLLLAAVYPFVKRVSHWPQAFLGAAFGWGAVMAWAAVRGTVEAAPVVIFAANICWSLAYDTIYAIVDREDDLKIGVKSTAILFGKKVHAALIFLYVACAVLLGAAGYLSGLGIFYYAGLALFLAGSIVVTLHVRGRATREAAFNGFVANAALGALPLIAIIIDSRF